MNLLTDAEKEELSGAIDDIHDSWKRDILIYREPEVAVISTNNNHNFAFQLNEQVGLSTTLSGVSGSFEARIWQPSMMSDFELKINLPDVNNFQVKAVCRLKLDDAGWNFIRDARKVIVDGSTYDRITEDRQHGLFSPKYHTIWLMRTQ